MCAAEKSSANIEANIIMNLTHYSNTGGNDQLRPPVFQKDKEDIEIKLSVHEDKWKLLCVLR